VDGVRAAIRAAVFQVEPFDERERADRSSTLAWIDSEAPLHRAGGAGGAGGDEPPRHLVAYFPLVDLRERAILLIDHVTSGLWLPPGGHVEAGEDPLRTVEREIVEELGRPARYTARLGSRPLFLSVARTVGAHSHTDVSLWYVVAGHAGELLRSDPREIRRCAWTAFADVSALPPERRDPHLERFVRKVERSLAPGPVPIDGP
jgi:8-oxo-dGTP diphosphatase